jgi:hypothetical protein
MLNEDDINIISHLPRGPEEDALSFKDYADAIYRILGLLKPENSGLTIGIFGSWGSGKSSTLKMVHKLFDVARKHPAEHTQYMGWRAEQMRAAPSFNGDPIVVSFEAWEYAKDEVWLAMLREIRTKVRGTLPLRRLFIASFLGWRSRIKPKELILWFVFRVILPISILLLGLELIISLPSVNSVLDDLANFFGLPPPVLTSSPPPRLTQLQTLLSIVTASFTLVGTLWLFFRFLLGGFSKSFRKKLDHGDVYAVEVFRREMKVLISTVGRWQPIVVLIDDLDRAPIEQIVPVLEAMKHFGSGSNLIDEEVTRYQHAPITFVLAADRTALHQAIINHYRNFWQASNNPEDAERFAREYLEKIIQIYFELPPLTISSLGRLFSQRTQGHPAVILTDVASSRAAVLSSHAPPMLQGGATELAIAPLVSSDGQSTEQPASSSRVAVEPVKVPSLSDALREAEAVFVQAPKENPREVIQARNTFIVQWMIIVKRLEGKQVERERKQPLPRLLATLMLIRYIWPDVFDRIVRYPELFFYLYALATNTKNAYCSETEREELLSLGCPSTSEMLLIEDTQHRYPNLTRLLETIRSSMKDAGKLTPILPETLNVDDLYQYFTLDPNASAPVGNSLSVGALALMSGDPVRIRFAARVRSDVAQEETYRLLEWIKMVPSPTRLYTGPKYTPSSAASESSAALDQHAEAHMIIALFALGRVGGSIAIEPIKQIIDARSEYPRGVVERALFALSHLVSELNDQKVQTGHQLNMLPFHTLEIKIAALRTLADVLADGHAELGLRLRAIRLLSIVAVGTENLYVREVVARVALCEQQRILRERAAELVKKGQWDREALKVLLSGVSTIEMFEEFCRIVFRTGKDQGAAVQLLPEIEQYLIGRVFDVEPFLSDEVLQGLSSSGSEISAEYSVKAGHAVRYSPFYALSTVPDPNQVIGYMSGVAQEALNRSRMSIAITAIKTMGQRQNAEASNADGGPVEISWQGRAWENLRVALQGKKDVYQETYFQTLGAIPRMEAVEFLEMELENENIEIRKYAREALVNISRQVENLLKKQDSTDKTKAYLQSVGAKADAIIDNLT